MNRSVTVDSPYLTTAEAAQYLRYPSVGWFRKQVLRYRIPCVQRGRRKFFTRQQLDSFMAVATETTAPVRRKSRTKAA
jgi:hypothetical protein